MKIKINNQFQEINENITIAQLLVSLFPTQNFFGIALAVNQLVIDKNDWDSFIVNEYDEVVLIKATQGG